MYMHLRLTTPRPSKLCLSVDAEDVGTGCRVCNIRPELESRYSPVADGRIRTDFELAARTCRAWDLHYQRKPARRFKGVVAGGSQKLVPKPDARSLFPFGPMKIFHCDHCQQLVFFENTKCVNCANTLAYLPDKQDLGTLELAEEGLRRLLAGDEASETYRLCHNYAREHVCNWAVAAADPNPYCLSCRLTRVIPNLGQTGSREAWYRLEDAKRRLIYSLFSLGLPVGPNADDGGLRFEFKADLPSTPGVLTGHQHGLITVNVAEADDAEREKRRLAMHEPYRTLLGHFRHEVGHYYWERLVEKSDRLDDFRDLFGDERQDYNESLQRHHKAGPPEDWPERFISAYASSHPWEDWAETWAHFLHMTDTLETAAACGLTLQPRRSDEPALRAAAPVRGCRPVPFDRLIEQWFPLTYVLNNLNRGMGLPDGYPFVLSGPAIDKLRLIHEIVAEAAEPAKESLALPRLTQTPIPGARCSEEATEMGSANVRKATVESC
jgi:hypothetical protein